MPCSPASADNNGVPTTARFYAGPRGLTLDKSSNIHAQQLGWLSIFPKKVRRRIFDYVLLPINNINVNGIKRDANVTGPIAIIIYSNVNMGLHSVSHCFTRAVAPSVKLSFYIQVVRDIHFPSVCYCTDAFYTAHVTMQGLNNINWSKFCNIELCYPRMRSFNYAKGIYGIDPAPMIPKPFMFLGIFPGADYPQFPALDLFYDGHMLTVNIMHKDVAEAMEKELRLKYPIPTFCHQGVHCSCTIQVLRPREVQADVKSHFDLFSSSSKVAELKWHELPYLPVWQSGRCGYAQTGIFF